MKYVDGDLVPNPNAEWQITEGTREWLRSTTEQAIAEGWSTQEMASQIRDAHAFSSERAEMIARTEIARADIAGSVEGWKASGLVDEKEWLTAPDCCDECQEMNGKKTPVGETFEDGKDVPLHPQCRCDCLPVIAETTNE
jgi:SPP1 gp7 family putative phage head morphogenesis protein